MKFLALTSYLLARITLTLISSFAITSCFQKVNFPRFKLVHLHSRTRYVRFLKNSLFYVETHLGLPPSKNNCVICLIENLLEIMKNAFYFILKAFVVLKIFKFLSRLFGHVGKKDKVNFKIHGVTTGFTNNCNTHITQYLTKKTTRQ